MITLSDLKQVAYAMSNDSNRRYLCGVQIEVMEDKIILTAVDGTRLATTTISHKEDYGQWTHTIPRDTVKQILATKAKRIAFSFPQENECVAYCDNVGITYKPLGGFPDYRRVIPNKAPKLAIRYNRKYLIDLLKALPDKNVEFMLQDHMEPALVMQGNSVHVLMPARMQGLKNTSKGIFEVEGKINGKVF